jgi:hypothetical protein
MKTVGGPIVPSFDADRDSFFRAVTVRYSTSVVKILCWTRVNVDSSIRVLFVILFSPKDFYQKKK